MQQGRATQWCTVDLSRRLIAFTNHTERSLEKARMRVSDDKEFIVRMAASMTFLIGASGLLGWAFDIAWLRSVIPRAVDMKPNPLLGCCFQVLRYGY